MTDAGEADPLRLALFEHLAQVMRLPGATDGLHSSLINDFTFEGRQVRLILARGIRIVRGVRAALTITTAYRRPGEERPYDDEVGPDGLLRYKNQGTDPQQADNRSLREAMRSEQPLAYFYGVGRATYLPIWPVWICDEDEARKEFAVSVDPAQRLLVGAAGDASPLKEYVERLTKERVHQRAFRAEVMRAYQRRCAVCNLGHERDLLDAAHIIADADDWGDPVVTNGIAMCKIHHAAYDRDIVGISADGIIAVRPDIRRETDGPMLQHGLKEMHDRHIILPHARSSRPDRDRLELRYRTYLEKAG